jgi:HAD superfamily hydrolase (TIGR01450 family)
MPRDFDNYIFDLDGTVWWWTELVPGAAETVDRLRCAGKNVHFITNNCILTRAEFVKKLHGLGIETDKEHIINPSIIAARLLKGKRAFVIGEGLVADLDAAGVRMVDSGATAVIVSEDTHVDYRKMTRAADNVFAGAKGYKTAAGGVWFVGRNRRVPGTGAFAAGLELCTRTQFELLGKPSGHMARLIRTLKLKPRKTLIVGDEISSDVALGKKLKFSTALVLTGRDSLKDYRAAKKKDRPDFVLKSMADIIKAL